MKTKPVIGILGGIGSGKSTVAACFADLGCAVVDADALAHEVLNEPKTIDAIVARFGPQALDTEGRIDRKALGRLVFDSPQGVAFSNQLIHPRVFEKCQTLIRNYRDDPKVSGIVLDMPLLAEVGWEKKCDFLVFVETSEQKRLARTQKNAKIDVNQLKKRENFQISLDKKRQYAHYKVNNNSDKSDLAEQVALIFSNITGSK